MIVRVIALVDRLAGARFLSCRRLPTPCASSAPRTSTAGKQAGASCAAHGRQWPVHAPAVHQEALPWRLRRFRKRCPDASSACQRLAWPTACATTGHALPPTARGSSWAAAPSATAAGLSAAAALAGWAQEHQHDHHHGACTASSWGGQLHVDQLQHKCRRCAQRTACAWLWRCWRQHQNCSCHLWTLRQWPAQRR